MLTSTDLIEQFREDVVDMKHADGSDDDVLWSDKLLLRYVNRAADKVARATLNYRVVGTVAVTAGDPYVSIADTRYLDIHYAYLMNARVELEPRNMGDDAPYRDYGVRVINAWRDARGTPRVYIRDHRPGKLRLYPTPDADDTLELTYSALPPPIDFNQPLPFVEEVDFDLMLMWMQHLAYNRPDVDTYDPARADRFKMLFDQAASERRAESNRRRRTAPIVVPEW